MKNISKYLKKEIFSFIDIIKVIQLVKPSKELINNLDIKQSLNMHNFCKIYYNNDNQEPSLYKLLEHFKSKVSKQRFIEIYTYFMNDYISKNPNKEIQLDLLLDVNIIVDIISKNLLKTNKISLIISSLNLLFNHNLNFSNYTCIDKVYFNILGPNYINKSAYKNFSYNKLYIELNNIEIIDDLLMLEYFKHLIPKSISQIGYTPLNTRKYSKTKLDAILKNKIRINNIYDEDLKIDCIKVYELIFEELSQYPNIKKFYFHFYELNDILLIFEKEKVINFIKNLNKINLNNISYEKEFIPKYKELLNKDYLKNKLKVNLNIHYDELNEINELFNIKLFNKLVIYDYKIKKKDNLVKIDKIRNLKKLCFNSRDLDFNFFELFPDLEKLKISYSIKDNYNLDYSLFHYLPKLKKISIRIKQIGKDSLTNLFKALNKYNKELVDINIFIDNFYNIVEEDQIILNTDIELKNLENLTINYVRYNNSYFPNALKINSINIDKCEKLKNITVPYYFCCNNRKVLNNLEKISIYYLESNNIDFFKMIMTCENLRHLYITFLLPYEHTNLINILFNNNKIRNLECESFPIYIGEEYTDEEKEINKEIDEKSNEIFLKDYMKIIGLKNFFFESLYALPKDDDYKEFELLSYNDKIKFLKNFPIIKQFGYIPLEQEYKFNKLDLDKEKQYFKEYLDYKDSEEMNFFDKVEYI